MGQFRLPLKQQQPTSAKEPLQCTAQQQRQLRLHWRACQSWGVPLGSALLGSMLQWWHEDSERSSAQALSDLGLVFNHLKTPPTESLRCKWGPVYFAKLWQAESPQLAVAGFPPCHLVPSLLCGWFTTKIGPYGSAPSVWKIIEDPDCRKSETAEAVGVQSLGVGVVCCLFAVPNPKNRGGNERLELPNPGTWTPTVGKLSRSSWRADSKTSKIFIEPRQEQVAWTEKKLNNSKARWQVIVSRLQMLPAPDVMTQLAAPNPSGLRLLKLWRAEVTHFPCGHQVQKRWVCGWVQPVRCFETGGFGHKLVC